MTTVFEGSSPPVNREVLKQLNSLSVGANMTALFNYIVVGCYMLKADGWYFTVKCRYKMQRCPMVPAGPRKQLWE